MTTATHYERIRREHAGTRALDAWRWAQHEHEIDGLEARADATDPDYPHPAIITFDGLETFELVVWDDDQPVDFGDTEPTDEERASTRALVVGWRWAGGEVRDVLGGVDYNERRDQPLRVAIAAALDFGMIETAELELETRAGFLEALAAAGGDFR